MCKTWKTSRLWLRFVVKERLARRHFNVPYVYWRLLPPLSQTFCRVSPAGGAILHHGMDGAISTDWHQHVGDSIARPANQIPASWLKY